MGDAFLARLRAVARECGYAVAVHGSEQRDLDLIAAPWMPEATSASTLVQRLCDDLSLIEYSDGRTRVRNPEPKPWGRLAWSLAGCPKHRYVDLSVVPRCGEPTPGVYLDMRSPSEGGERGE